LQNNNNQQTKIQKLSPQQGRNIFLVLSYDGTSYCGWQKQTKENSIQSVLENAIKKITGEKVKVIGAGRTDSNVHALGQTANTIIKSRISEEKFLKALNAVLPWDIRVLKVVEKPLGFSARYSAKRRWYRYYIYNAEPLSPFWARYAWYYPYKLNIKLMKKYLKVLKGCHDFTSFCSVHDESETKVRTIYKIGLTVQKPLVIFDVIADGFLQHMIRIIVGTVVEYQKKNIPPIKMKEVLMSRNRTSAGSTAPACGLFLMKIIY